MKKIEKLTKEQKEKLVEYKDKWLKIGLCTKATNKILAEKALIDSYKIAGLTPPKKIIWVESPLAGALAIQILKDKKISKEKLGASVRDSVRDSVMASVWNSVRDSVRDSVMASVWNSVGDSVWNSVRDSVRDSVMASVWNSVGGQQDAGYLGFYDYFREVLNLVKETEKIKPLTYLALEANWFYPYKEICVISEKPIKCEVDEKGKLHSYNGPAIEYKDGFCVYSIHGKRLTEGSEEYNKMIHNFKFNNQLDELLK